MDIKTLIALQFIAHLFTDYFLQSDNKSKDKNQFGFKSKFLRTHFIIALLTSWLLSFHLKFGIASAIIASVHILIDGFKKTFNDNKHVGKYIFYIDQILHILVFVTATILFEQYCTPYGTWNFSIEWNYVLISAAYLICLKPANIFIKQVFLTAGISDQTNDDLEKAGRLIGSLERILTLTFVILGQYEAVGFLIAAKSILRFKEGETAKTEYVLIGTMLSFAIAIGIGLLFIKLKS